MADIPAVNTPVRQGKRTACLALARNIALSLWLALFLNSLSIAMPTDNLPVIPGVITPGELVLENGKTQFEPWDSHDTFARPPILVIHIAARLGLKSQVDTLRQRIDQEAYQPSELAVVSIVDFDDALWGTRGLANIELQHNKKQTPQIQVIRDDQGLVRHAWKLPQNTLFVAFVDDDGTLLYRHLGLLNEEDMNALIREIDQRVGRL